jgi:S-adenosyl-L-methionine hydrolase (adenosine-forming)
VTGGGGESDLTVSPGHCVAAPHPSHQQTSSPPTRLITLLTDFGIADYFVSAMKGVILSINRDAQIIDITHEIPAHDIEAAAFTLLAARTSFPSETIHVAVVDPGVGSDRRPILMEAGGQYFVGPDNGIFSYICDAEPLNRIFHLKKQHFQTPVSSTFHGRDVFAPVAAALSKGIAPEALGEQVTNSVRLPPLAPQQSRDGSLRGRIIHIDRFGNCVTNLTPKDLTQEMIARGAHLIVNGSKVKSFQKFFLESDRGNRKVFGIWGSAGFLELAARGKSAARMLKAKRGQKVVVRAPKM